MNNLEKFDLQKALEGAELVTRDGRKVKEWYYFKLLKESYPIKVLINDSLDCFTIDGKFYNSDKESSADLFIKPKVEETWINIYRKKDGSIFTGAASFNTKEDAISNRMTSANYIKTIRITDEIE